MPTSFPHGPYNLRCQRGQFRTLTVQITLHPLLLILVAYTVIEEEDEVIRIISARRVTRQERIEYEEAQEI